MKLVEPVIFHLAQTSKDTDGIQNLLKFLGVPDWTTDSPSDSETVIEIAGRSCYKSFSTELNKNLTKVRGNNKDYIENVINKHDGSVIEHCMDTYAICNVSRVFTHELVRHRHCAFSQESLRFVRLDNLSAYYPDVFINLKDKAISEDVSDVFFHVFTEAENVQKELAAILGLDQLNFEQKKKFTSAMRRLAPIGLATMIVMSTNHRNWRWLIEMRTSPYAEEEIRHVFVEIYQDLKQRYPNLYFDSIEEEIDGVKSIKFRNSKI